MSKTLSGTTDTPLSLARLAVCCAASVALSGCSFFSKSETGATSYETDATSAELRDTPGQPYRFGDDEMFTTTVNGSGKAGEFYQNTTEYDVVFYDQPAGLRRTAASYTPVSDPRDVAFISLNGETRPADWQNCERTHRGYLYASDSILRLSPMFEVCMRNKGYVLTTELGVSSSQGLTAASAGQSRQFTPYTPAQTYTYPSL